MANQAYTLPQQLHDRIATSKSLARAAARRGDHIEALVRLALAEAYARSRMLYFATRKGGYGPEFEAKRDADMIAEEVERAREFIANGSQDTAHVVCTSSGEYMPALPQRSLEERGQPTAETLMALTQGRPS